MCPLWFLGAQYNFARSNERDTWIGDAYHSQIYIQKQIGHVDRIHVSTMAMETLLNIYGFCADVLLEFVTAATLQQFVTRSLCLR